MLFTWHLQQYFSINHTFLKNKVITVTWPSVAGHEMLPDMKPLGIRVRNPLGYFKGKDKAAQLFSIKQPEYIDVGRMTE